MDAEERMGNDAPPTAGRSMEEVFILLYRELKAVAASKLSLERGDHTLQATALVHEAYLKIGGQEKVPENRQQFVCTVSEAMRRILVDHARRRLAEKRGAGAEHEALEEDRFQLAEKPDHLIELDEALAEFKRIDPEGALVVELKFFGGFKMEEIAQMLDISLRKAEKTWASTRLWLYDRLRS